MDYQRNVARLATNHNKVISNDVKAALGYTFTPVYSPAVGVNFPILLVQFFLIYDQSFTDAQSHTLHLCTSL